jgi:hypothetical protein
MQMSEISGHTLPQATATTVDGAHHSVLRLDPQRHAVASIGGTAQNDRAAAKAVSPRVISPTDREHSIVLSLSELLDRPVEVHSRSDTARRLQSQGSGQSP